MSNTVRRPRRRPRKDSCAWKSFGWLLIRASALALLTEHLGARDGPWLRQWLADSRAEYIKRFIARRHELNPRATITYTFRG